MIEPTDEMVAAYEQARRAYWTALGHEAPEGGPTVAEHGRESSRAGLKAVFELVERDYLTVMADLVDTEPCWFDHHGGCQAHGFLSLEPGERCPHALAKELLGIESTS